MCTIHFAEKGPLVDDDAPGRLNLNIRQTDRFI